ncbi:MAG: phosphodiester glycosidase family protein, partial [Oscillospiraceae bacterium]|nr:phosphodiester glycosidase family protein [Oscillospiraceae bacterium]
MFDLDQNSVERGTAPEQVAKEKRKKETREKWKSAFRVIDRIFGFFLATAIMFGIAGLGLEYVLVKGPSTALKEKFVMTMLESRRFGFMSKIFLNADEVDEIFQRSYDDLDVQFDPSMIQIAPQVGQQTETAQQPETDTTGSDPYGYVDEDGDGYILVDVKGKGYSGHMMIVLDPKRCYVAEGGEGQTINQIAARTGAIGGINGGAFQDPDGTGTGRDPEGLTIIDGRLIDAGQGYRESFVGFDADGVMHVGYYNFRDAMDAGIVSGVSFYPPLIINGVPQEVISGVNPRT